MSTIAFKSNPFTTLFRSTKMVGIYPTTDKVYHLSYDDGDIVAEAEYIVDVEKSIVFDGERDVLYWDAYDARITHLYVCGSNDLEMEEVSEVPEWLYQRLVNCAVDNYNDNYSEPVGAEEPQWEAEMKYW